MNDTNISGVFTIESKNQKISQKNMVVEGGVEQVFNWFRLANYAKKPTGETGEILFSKKGIERKRLVVSEGITAKIIDYDGVEQTGDDYNITNVKEAVDGNDDTYLDSKYRGNYKRIINLQLANEMNIKGIALYGKEERYSNDYPDYATTITLTRKIGEETYAKKTFQTQVLLTPYTSYSYVSFEENNELWVGGSLYVYITFDELFNTNDWKFYTKDENGEYVPQGEYIPPKDFQNSITPEKPYLESISEIEIVDRDYAYMQINEIDIYTHNNNLYNAPSFFKIGKANTETSYNQETLSEEVNKKIEIEEAYITDDGKVRFIAYISDEEFNNVEIGEVGIFFEQNGEEKMFARTALSSKFIVPTDSYVKIIYDLEIS